MRLNKTKQNRQNDFNSTSAVFSGLRYINPTVLRLSHHCRSAYQVSSISSINSATGLSTLKLVDALCVLLHTLFSLFDHSSTRHTPPPHYLSLLSGRSPLLFISSPVSAELLALPAESRCLLHYYRPSSFPQAVSLLAPGSRPVHRLFDRSYNTKNHWSSRPQPPAISPRIPFVTYNNSDQYSSTASNGNGNRSGRKTNSRPHSRNEGRRDISAGNKNPSTGPATAADHDSPPGQNNQRRGSTQRAGNPTGRKPNDPASNQARRASDVGPSSGGDNTLSGSIHAPKGRMQSGSQRKPSIDKNAGSKSTLNPNAGGFQPGALSSIMDVDAEVLVTPTPGQTHFNHESLQRPASNFAGGFIGELPDNAGAFARLTGLNNARGFAFPGGNTLSNNHLAQQLMQQQQMQFLNNNFSGPGSLSGLNDLQATVQQQALQVVQMQAALQAAQAQGNHANVPRFSNVDVMSPLSESLQIQQQLEMLRHQQEALMNRFGDLHTNTPPDRSQPVHRRGQSAQVGGGQSNASNAFGAMGRFGLDGAGAFNQGMVGNDNFANSMANGGSANPKGHGRRHSVQVSSNTGSNNHQQLGFPGQNFQFPPASVPSSTFSTYLANPVGSDLDFGMVGFSNNGSGAQGHRRGHSKASSISNIGGFNMDFGAQASTDLNQAQMQLQQLAQFRAASGHTRVPSFGFQNPMNLGPGQSNVGQGSQQMRKSLFAPYLPQASIPPLLAAGKLVIGVLRVNKRNRSDAYVATDSLDSDIYICGSKDRNRALEGDVVAVELLDVDEVWGTKKEKEEKKRKKEENQAFDSRVQQNNRREDKKRDDVEVEGQGLTLFEEEEVNDEQRPNFAGHIVAVVERMPGQLFSGTLGLLRPSSAATKEKQEAERREREGVDLRGGQREEQRPKIVWHRPTDKRVPLIAIPVDQAPADFLADPNKYASTLFIAGIKRWPITSLHPFGTLVEELGPIGDIEVETNALLKDCNFTSEEFSENVVKCLPPLPWTIPEREYEVRRDFRNQIVFTIDGATARDLDDALHISKNDDGTYEVGVHIADVTHFVKPGTALDREARKRATTVYLVQRAVPMLPPSLSEHLCSLSPGQDKLTFSAVFKMTPQGRVIDTWFGKSIICSSAKLTYDSVQQVITDDAMTPDLKIEKEGVTAPQICKSLKALGQLSRQMRARRFEEGCLRIDNIRLDIKLDEEGLPDDCSVVLGDEAKQLVEEFMLLANTAVAKKIAAGLPEQAMLRRHEAPIERRLEGFAKRAAQMGFEVDTSSAGALMKSINSMEQAGKAPHFVLQLLSTKAMVRAKYFCGGALDIAKWSHYALNLPVYTHFTSPIRRFADVVVHRQLEAVLSNSCDVKFTMDPDSISKCAQFCNVKKHAARLAEEQSQHLFLCVLIADLTAKYGPVIRSANVIGVWDEAFDVAVPDFGIEKRVHVDQMPIDNHVHDEHANTLKLYWKQGVDVIAHLSEHSTDAHLNSIRHHTERHAKLMEASSQSVQAESALFEDDEDDVVQHPLKGGSGQMGELTEREKKSAQRLKSAEMARAKGKLDLEWEGVEKIEAAPGVTHCVQTIKELQTVPVIITADTTKSPPVLKIFAVNPFA
ncbi:hypothetical protein PCANC_17125 [Puccinia coronata f. sp. avenae]|uniref:DIS3-like exonuclease 2 n=1 Tax=Puccinia coronata f. sp. avenae TaxID=200324 RepID=A0A2N5U1E3_9BASI|nr:hypothetical protein PCANC_17125 [Puccinia coronata f. sp. avenae]